MGNYVYNRTDISAEEESILDRGIRAEDDFRREFSGSSWQYVSIFVARSLVNSYATFRGKRVEKAG